MIHKRTLGLSLTLILLALSRQASAEPHLSARMYSLGGESVAGIIPDLYTDIDINPAYASFCDSLAINYGYRSAPSFNPRLPYLGSGGGAYSYYSSYPTNEVFLYGLKASLWRIALAAEYGIDDQESADGDLVLETRWSYEQTFSQRATDVTEDFWRIDLAAARPVGESMALGFRLRGYGYYDTHSSAWTRSTDGYTNASFAQLARQNREDSGDSELGRQPTIDFQAGIIKEHDADRRSEVIIRLAITPIDNLLQEYSLSLYKSYDSIEELNAYSYRTTLWSDRRSGDLWTYGLSVRHALSGGVRIFGGGSLSRCSYAAEWSDFRRTIEWRPQSSNNETFSSSFSGDGCLTGGTVFLKAGKTFSVHRTLDLFVGLNMNAARKHADESPIIRYAHTYLGSLDTTGVTIDLPSTLKYTGTTFGAYLPLSLEFRPAAYISFFSAFTLYGTWFKRTTEQSVPSFFEYVGPGDSPDSLILLSSIASSQASIPSAGTITDSKRGIVTSKTITLGFSLHYRDKLFFDVYMGSELFAQNLSGKIIDVRYCF